MCMRRKVRAILEAQDVDRNVKRQQVSFYGPAIEFEIFIVSTVNT